MFLRSFLQAQVAIEVRQVFVGSLVLDAGS